MILIKTEKEIEQLRIGGAITAAILQKLASAVIPGVTTASIDALAYSLITDAGCIPAFLNYTPVGADRPFPASVCISINDEVVHGIPGDRVIANGDVVVVDLGVKYQNVFLDHAITVGAGMVTAKDAHLISATKTALDNAIAAIDSDSPAMKREKEGKGVRTVGDIGYAVQSYIKKQGLTVVRDLSGHGVGRAIHEDPFIPNYGKEGKGESLVPGMVIAIEPIISRGGEDLLLHSDGYTLSTTDHSRAAHFEHTVLITEDGVEILTK